MVKKITESAIVSLYLNDYGRRLYLREIAVLLEKPHQTVKPHVEQLVKDRVLIKKERKKMVEYYLNFKDKSLCDYIVIAEKIKLIERLQKEVLLKVLFERLTPFFKKNTFIMFGSAVDKIQKDSDIDLLVTGKEDVMKEIEDFEKIYNKKVHKIQLKSIEAVTVSLLREVYKKHLIFNNTEEIVRLFDELHEQNKLV